MAAVTICSDFGPLKIKSLTISIVFPSICHEVTQRDVKRGKALRVSPSRLPQTRPSADATSRRCRRGPTPAGPLRKHQAHGAPLTSQPPLALGTTTRVAAPACALSHREDPQGLAGGAGRTPGAGFPRGEHRGSRHHFI